MKLKEFNNNYIYFVDKHYDDWNVITPLMDSFQIKDAFVKEHYKCLNLVKK